MLSLQDKWCSETLDEVFRALSLSQELSERLVYKGARVLRLLLGETTRASLDIDASLASVSANMRIDENELEYLRSLADKAITNYFEDQNPIRYSLQRSSITNRRKLGPHPRGWDVYELRLEIKDLAAFAATVNAPLLQIDIAAPEASSNRSFGPIFLDGRQVIAVTLERMIGEKLRAFLSSLPQYR